MKTYQSYKPSGVEWIGDIPVNWNLLKLKHEYKIQKGRIPKTINEKEEKGLVPYLSMDVLRGSETLSYVSKEDGVFVKEGQILILWDGSNSGEIIKVVKEGIMSSTMGVLNKIGDKLHEDFSFYQLKSYEPEIRNNTNGMGIPHVDGQYVRSLVLLTPPINEQEQIVKYLDDKTSIIDKLISTKERKIELLKEQRSSLINQIITKGLNPNVKMKDSGVEWIGEIPESWNLISIKHLVSTKITDGPHETPIFVDNGVPFLSVESVQDGKLDFNKKRGFISVELNNIYSKKCLPKRDDVLIVKSGSTTGKSTIVETDELFNIWSPLCMVRSNKNKIIPRFTFTSIQSNYFRKFIEIGWSFGTQPNIGMGVIENLKLVVPTNIKEQQEIVEYLDTHTKEIDDLVQLEQKKIELLKEYRQSLISEVITGKIKVVE
jgi:type I restriction enzyme S subunit